MTLVSVCPRRIIILRTRPQDESNPAVTAVTMNTRWDGERMETSLPYTKAAAVSKDGTIIGYRQLGKGPGVILIHGGMEASQHFMQLATLLANSFTVAIPDRRGRGMSGPFAEQYSVTKECEDITALVEQTRAERIFGLSSGALIVLRSALVVPSLKHVASTSRHCLSGGRRPRRG